MLVKVGFRTVGTNLFANIFFMQFSDDIGTKHKSYYESGDGRSTCPESNVLKDVQAGDELPQWIEQVIKHYTASNIFSR